MNLHMHVCLTQNNLNIIIMLWNAGVFIVVMNIIMKPQSFLFMAIINTPTSHAPTNHHWPRRLLMEHEILNFCKAEKPKH